MPWHKQRSIRSRGAVFTKTLYMKFKEGTSKLLHLERSFLCGAETWTLREVDKKYLGKFCNVVLEKDGDQLN